MLFGCFYKNEVVSSCSSVGPCYRKMFQMALRWEDHAQPESAGKHGTRQKVEQRQEGRGGWRACLLLFTSLNSFHELSWTYFVKLW